MCWYVKTEAKSDDRVGHLNTIWARGGGKLNNIIFKSANARISPGEGVLKFRVDRHITDDEYTFLACTLRFPISGHVMLCVGIFLAFFS